MNMIPVRSSNLASVGYDGTTSTMRVRFTSGASYDYTGVPAYLHEGMMQAESVGGYFSRNIRPFHTTSKVAEEKDEGLE